jgi:AraC-like DNA-binding protein
MPEAEQVRWDAHPDLPGVEFLSVRSNGRRWKVYHETYSLCVVERTPGIPAGAGAEWVYRGATHHSPEHTTSLMEPGESHHNPRPTPPGNFKVAMLSAEAVNRAAQECGLRSPLHFKRAVTRDPELMTSILRLQEATAHRESLLARESLLVECIGILVRKHAERSGRPLAQVAPRRLRLVRDCLQERLFERVTLDELARLSGLSRFHLVRAFSKEFGLPPHAWQMNARIQRVAALIRNGISPWMLEAGFADASHLIRHFKRVIGVTPGQYAAMVS